MGDIEEGRILSLGRSDTDSGWLGRVTGPLEKSRLDNYRCDICFVVYGICVDGGV